MLLLLLLPALRLRMKLLVLLLMLLALLPRLLLTHRAAAVPCHRRRSERLSPYLIGSRCLAYQR